MSMNHRAAYRQRMRVEHACCLSVGTVKLRQIRRRVAALITSTIKLALPAQASQWAPHSPIARSNLSDTSMHVATDSFDTHTH